MKQASVSMKIRRGEWHSLKCRICIFQFRFQKGNFDVKDWTECMKPIVSRERRTKVNSISDKFHQRNTSRQIFFFSRITLDIKDTLGLDSTSISSDSSTKLSITSGTDEGTFEWDLIYIFSRFLREFYDRVYGMWVCTYVYVGECTS